LGGREDHTVSADDGVFQRRHGWRDPMLDLVIAVVQRNAVKGADIQHGTGGHEAGGRPQERGVERLAPQAAGDTDNRRHLERLARAHSEISLPYLSMPDRSQPRTPAVASS